MNSCKCDFRFIFFFLSIYCHWKATNYRNGKTVGPKEKGDSKTAFLPIKKNKSNIRKKNHWKGNKEWNRCLKWKKWAHEKCTVCGDEEDQRECKFCKLSLRLNLFWYTFVYTLLFALSCNERFNTYDIT